VPKYVGDPHLHRPINREVDGANGAAELTNYHLKQESEAGWKKKRKSSGEAR